MGSCLSKKKVQTTALNVSVPVKKPETGTVLGPPPGLRAKKEIFVIKHKRSHERERDVSPPLGSRGSNNGSVPAEEEVDAILIQCGRLSRNNSSENVGVSWSSKYSGSKRSYDFDKNDEAAGSAGDDGGDEYDGGQTRRDRSRDRQSSRRRTPSRDRRDQQYGSRERRRVSRSPGRRPESNSNTNVGNGSNRPGKLVSIPATVSSLATDKSNNGAETTAIKRISVKRNVGENAASPHSISPARVNVRAANESSSHHQQPLLSSRNSSRKAEHSPYRRNPLAQIDPNSLVNNKGLPQKPNTETNNRIITKQGNSIGSLDNKTKFAEEQQQHTEEAAPANASVWPGNESSRPQMLTRNRSARRSRELDINSEAILDHSPSYTTLLLEDIQNFHQKSVHIPAVSLPPCLSKAHSILEAVADLNSTTSSTRSVATVGANLVGRKLSETKEPFVESEIQPSNYLMEPSIHKYVTSRRVGTLPEEDMEQESSGSNNYIGGNSQQQCAKSTSSWEPNSADSTDRWTSRTELASSTEDSWRGFSGQRTGIGRGRVGGGKILQTVPIAASAASTRDR